MDRSTEFPWSWEEEAEWKADLEERDRDFLEGLIDLEELIGSAVEDGAAECMPARLSLPTVFRAPE